MPQLLLALALLLSLTSHAQTDQRKLDSLRHSIDSSSRALQAYQDSFTRRQESIHNAATRRGKQPQPVSVEDRERGQRSKAPAKMPVIVALLALMAAIIGIWRRRKNKNSAS